MIGFLKSGKQMTERQRRFGVEIITNHYTKDEAYCAVINSKSRYAHYSEFEEVIEDHFE